jgi:hypothetical protein
MPGLLMNLPLRYQHQPPGFVTGSSQSRPTVHRLVSTTTGITRSVLL